MGRPSEVAKATAGLGSRTTCSCRPRMQLAGNEITQSLPDHVSSTCPVVCKRYSLAGSSRLGFTILI
jgi:hypothetical protein